MTSVAIPSPPRTARTTRLIWRRREPPTAKSPKSSFDSRSSDVRTRMRTGRPSSGLPVSHSTTGSVRKSGNAVHRADHGPEPAGGAAVSPEAASSPPESGASEMSVVSDPSPPFSLSKTCTPFPFGAPAGCLLRVTAPWNRMTLPVSFSTSRRRAEPSRSVRTSVPDGRGSAMAAKTFAPDFATNDERDDIHACGSRSGAAWVPARSAGRPFGCQIMPSSDGVAADATASEKARARAEESRVASRRGARSCARAAAASRLLVSAASTRRVPSWPAMTRRPA